MYTLQVNPKLDRKFAKLARKNPSQMRIINRKVAEILDDPHPYKILHAPLHHLRRVHIDSSFVLTFSIDEENKKVVLEDYDHHDRIYIE